MGRAPCCDKANVKRGPWSPEEDAILKNFVEKHGTGGNWIALPHKAGLKRCGKSCRLRWLNYLRPDIKHGGFSEEEDNIICSLYSSIGTRWSIIAAQLPGRTDNDIKNYWNTRLKKKLLGKNVKDDQQTRRLLAKETTVAMRYNTTSIASEAMCASNTPSPSVSFTDPYALETTNVPILLQDPSSAESPVSKTRELFHGTTHISDYSSITSILMRALENNKSENPSQIPTPIVNNPHEALYAQRSLNIKAETFDESDTHLPYSLPSQWETCGVNNYQSGMWMQNEVVNNAAHESNFSYVLPGDNQMNDLFYSNNNGSMQIKQEPNYGITTASDTAAYWVSHLDQKPSAYSYILPSEGNTNSTSQGIFQEGIIY